MNKRKPGLPVCGEAQGLPNGSKTHRELPPAASRKEGQSHLHRMMLLRLSLGLR